MSVRLFVSVSQCKLFVGLSLLLFNPFLVVSCLIFNDISSHVLFKHKSYRSWRMIQSQFLCLTSTRPPSKGFSPGLLSIRCALDLDYELLLSIILVLEVSIIFLCENFPSYFCEKLPSYLSDIFVLKGGEDRARVGGEAGPEGIGEVRDPPLLPALGKGLFVAIFEHFHMFVCLSLVSKCKLSHLCCRHLQKVSHLPREC